MLDTTIHCLCLNPALDIAGVADKVHVTRKIRVHDQCEYPGGGSVNVARVVNKLGSDVFLSFLSGGIYGDELAKAIDDLGIPNHRIHSEVNTRLSYTVFEEDTFREYRFISEGKAQPTGILQEAIDFLDTVDCEMLVLSGSLPTNTPTDTYAKIANRVSSRGIKVVLDCSGEALNATIDKAPVFLLKPSFGELESLAGKKLDEPSAIAFSQLLVQQGKASIVAVSMGQHGAFVCTENRTLRAPAVRVKVRSAVGAGDSFVAGMVARLAQNKTLEDAFSYAVASGAAAVMTAGTQLCDVAHIRSLLPSIVVTKIK